MSKYQVTQIIDLDIWQKNVEKTPQYTMFVSPSYLNSFGGKYQLYFVNKGSEFKAAFCILLSDDETEVVLDELVIYAGLFFCQDATQKEVKAKSERFEITEEIIRFLTNKFSNIEMALSTKIEDMRPFLWHNYGLNDKDKVFSLDLRYTSYIDISELKDIDNPQDSLIFKNLETLRQRNIKKAIKEKAYTTQELNIELFLEYYTKLMDLQNQKVSKQKLQNMANVINNSVNNKQAVMFCSKNSKDDIIYITVFSYDKYRAYYLFGAGNLDAKESYKGTICFWDAFINLAKKYDIKEVDMEGINSPARGWFKLSFGGDITPYYEIKIG
ncbi:MAG: hypothetical protein JXQ66_03570 [Campylobacterales bacterium]|nr:hypothetical protein [Campylobacterales bacterium]